MWVFMSDSFLSIVAHEKEPAMLLVRARAEGDIERAFPEVEATLDRQADYLYRAVIPRERVAQRLGELVSTIGYPNFKNTVKEAERHDAYMDIWQTMYRLQVSSRTEW